MSGILCHVTWNNHSSTFLNFLATLQSKNIFCDATVVCHGKYYSVHQLVLSTCSEYFFEIFEQVKCKHPFIIIKDIKPPEFEALLSYMYKGMVNVAEEKLSLFIKAAEALKVKGLAAPDDPHTQGLDFGSSRRAAPTIGLSPQIKKRKLTDSPSPSKFQQFRFNQLMETPAKGHVTDEPTDSNSLLTSQISNDFVPAIEKNQSPLHRDCQLPLLQTVEHRENFETENTSSFEAEPEVLEIYEETNWENEPIYQHDSNVPNVISQASPSQKMHLSEPIPILISPKTSPSNVSTRVATGQPPQFTTLVDSHSSESTNILNSSTMLGTTGYNNIRSDSPMRDHRSYTRPMLSSTFNPMVKLNSRVVKEYTKIVKQHKDTSQVDSVDSEGEYSAEDTDSEATMEDTPSLGPQSEASGSHEMEENLLDPFQETDNPLNATSINIEPRSCRKGKTSMLDTSPADKTLQMYNLDHIPLSNVFTYRVFRDVNLFIEYMLKDGKREDAFGKSLITIFKMYINYKRICDTIANTFDDTNCDHQGKWIACLARLDPPLFGKHLQYDAANKEILLGNDVIPALMVIWQFRHLISRHSLIKDIKPGFTSRPRQRFIKGIQQKAKYFHKEKLCIFKTYLRTFYRYSLTEKEYNDI